MKHWRNMIGRCQNRWPLLVQCITGSSTFERLHFDQTTWRLAKAYWSCDRVVVYEMQPHGHRVLTMAMVLDPINGLVSDKVRFSPSYDHIMHALSSLAGIWEPTNQQTCDFSWESTEKSFNDVATSDLIFVHSTVVFLLFWSRLA